MDDGLIQSGQEPEDAASEMAGTALRMVRGGHLRSEVVSRLRKKFKVSRAEADRAVDSAMSEFGLHAAVQGKSSRPQNMGLASARLSEIYRTAMSEFRRTKKSGGKSADRYLKLAIESLRDLHRLQGLVGPSSLIQVGIGFGQGSSSGPSPIPVDAGSDLIAEARARGLPVPSDLDLKALAIEAGKAGETLLITPQDAASLERAEFAEKEGGEA